MKAYALLLLLLLSPGDAGAETYGVPFKQPEKFPLRINLLLPKQGSTLLSHEQKEDGDTITARIEEGDELTGMLVEAVDVHNRRLWQHDFGYNASAVPGCAVSVSFHPQLAALIVTYQGYKWDHAHKLLLLEKIGATCKVREYSKDAPDIVPFLKKQPGFSSEYTYWVYPERFAGTDLVFSCIPLALPDRQTAHPLAQEQSWFEINAAMNSEFKITPLHAKASH